MSETLKAINEVSTSIIKLPKTGQNKNILCDLCHVAVGSKRNYEQHINGAKHNKKVLQEIRKKKKKDSDKEKEQNKKNINDDSKSPSLKISEKTMNSSNPPSMKRTENEIKPVRSLSVKRNPKRTFVRQEYRPPSNYDSYSQNNYHSNRKGRSNWYNYNYNAWYDGPHSGNYDNYNNRNSRYYQGSNYENYYDQQDKCYAPESMENCPQERPNEAESVIMQYPGLNNTECSQENNKMSQNHMLYSNEHSLNLDSLNTNLTDINYDSRTDSLEIVKSSKNVLPLKMSGISKGIGKISRNSSESTLVSNSASIPVNTNSAQEKISSQGENNSNATNLAKIPEDATLGQRNSATNCDKVAPLPAVGISSECDKQLDKRSPPENMSDRISHWINPSSLKDKAEVDKLMTEYSKSRKKENLLRLKQHGEKSECNDKCSSNTENRFQTCDHLQSPPNSMSIDLNQEENKSLKILEEANVSPKKVTDSNCPDGKTLTKSPPKVKRRKKSSLSESSLNSSDAISGDGCYGLLQGNIRTYSKSPAARSSSLNRNQSNICKKGRSSRASFDSSLVARDEVVSDMPVEMDNAVLGKRRNSFQQVNKSKKHKCSASECLEKCIHEEREKMQANLQVSNTVTENSSVYSDIYINTEELNLKKETFENLHQVTSSEVVSNQGSSEININNTEILNVEDLMKMFASQNVKIKKEFDDPLIDAIQNMDVNLLFNVCDKQSSGPKEKNPNLLPNQSQLPICASDVPTTQPVITGSYQEKEKTCNSGLHSNSENSIEKSSSVHCGMENYKLSDSSLFPKSNNSIPESSLVKCDVVKDISNNPGVVPESKNNSTQNSDSFETIFPGLSPINVYVNISNELKKLQKEEEEKRTNLKSIERKIELHQKILNDLNVAKIKLQTEEDNLISRRNSLTCALSHCISRDSLTTSADSDKSLKSSNSINHTESLPSEKKSLLNEKKQISTVAVTENTSQINSIEEIPSTSQCDKQVMSQKDLFVEDNEEIIIIPKEPAVIEIPVIDLVDLESPEKLKETSNKENENTISREIFYEIKDFTAHKTVVNSLKVLNQYLYTCANDYTAKRFNLKNLEEIVTYTHKKRNVLHLCVETYKDTTIVFTLCSLDKFISLFKADDGLPLKKYSFEFVAASITNGWGKVFAGLNNGQVVVCNSNETKDLVRNLEPVKSMACTYQGGLHILIILSINGQVAVRDVDRNGLLIRYVKAHNDTPLFMNVYNDYVYLSSSLVLTVTDLTNGSLKHKIKLTAPITGLAAHKNNIFTTSFSGLIRCYPDGQAEKMKMAYGVGNSVTSICVSQGWVFTANRNGEIGAFKFDPIPEFHCKISNCQNVFTRKEDLKRHLLGGIDHQISNKPNSKCPWRRCNEKFTKDWKIKDRKNHLEYHVNNLPEWTDLS